MAVGSFADVCVDEAEYYAVRYGGVIVVSIKVKLFVHATLFYHKVLQRGAAINFLAELYSFQVNVRKG